MIALLLYAILSIPGDTYEIKYREVWTPVQTCINGRCYTTYKKTVQPYYAKVSSPPVKSSLPPAKDRVTKPKPTNSLFGLSLPVKKKVEKKKPLTFGL